MLCAREHRLLIHARAEAGNQGSGRETELEMETVVGEGINSRDVEGQCRAWYSYCRVN